MSTSYHFRANIVIDHCGFCFLLFTDDETTYPFPVDTKRINELVHSRKLARTFRQGRYECDVDDNSALDCCGREPHTRSIALDGELKTNFWNEKINKPHTDGWYTRGLAHGQAEYIRLLAHVLAKVSTGGRCSTGDVQVRMGGGNW